MIKTYLGFDVGTKRTGIAIANSLTNQAIGIDVVTHHKNGSTNWDGFDQVINAHSINLFVVGLPLDKEVRQNDIDCQVVRQKA
jgi:Predicted endonuclease involved in recombination (possible Holliday junction resolvase in Mycoplasmas and B. subtilis)